MSLRTKTSCIPVISVYTSGAVRNDHICFLEQETLLLLLSTGWFQEWIRAWFHNQTKIYWRPYWRL